MRITLRVAVKKGDWLTFLENETSSHQYGSVRVTGHWSPTVRCQASMGTSTMATSPIHLLVDPQVALRWCSSHKRGVPKFPGAKKQAFNLTPDPRSIWAPHLVTRGGMKRSLLSPHSERSRRASVELPLSSGPKHLGTAIAPGNSWLGGWLRKARQLPV